MSARQPAGPSNPDTRNSPPERPARSPILDNEQPEQAFEEDIPKDDDGNEAEDPHRSD
ncbi:hypothetical protein [Methylibium rhizosphaerae]|uniref:hypothetical protein n=1 Tax=Methylibium rhizosphaerae TaxID=2570323 RepID=UPI0015E42C10|nr:hypothetical protein [Methylibium rhizosphaerae]